MEMLLCQLLVHMYQTKESFQIRLPDQIERGRGSRSRLDGYGNAKEEMVAWDGHLTRKKHERAIEPALPDRTKPS